MRLQIRRDDDRRKRMKYMIAALCLVFAGAAYADEQAVVVRDKNNNYYLVTYDCDRVAKSAKVRNVSVGEPILIRDQYNRRRQCTITEVKTFA